MRDYLGDFKLSTVTDAFGNSVLNQASKLAADTDIVRLNRARTAALADYGYLQFDRYEYYRPVVFTGSVIICGMSIAAVIKRRKILEAWPLYFVLAGLSGGVAWFTRPDLLRTPPAPVPPQTAENPPPPALQRFLGWLDNKIQKNTLNRPGWESQTYQRLASDLGFSTIPEHVKVLLTRNTL